MEATIGPARGVTTIKTPSMIQDLKEMVLVIILLGAFRFELYMTTQAKRTTSCRFQLVSFVSCFEAVFISAIVLKGISLFARWGLSYPIFAIS